MSKKPEISSMILFRSIIQVIDNLTLPLIIQIRDKCNEVIMLKTQPPVIEEPDEFKTWRTPQMPHGGFDLYRNNTR